MLPVDQHLGVTFVLGVLGLLEEALIGVEIHVEDGGLRFVLILP